MRGGNNMSFEIEETYGHDPEKAEKAIEMIDKIAISILENKREKEKEEVA